MPPCSIPLQRNLRRPSPFPAPLRPFLSAPNHRLEAQQEAEHRYSHLLQLCSQSSNLLLGKVIHAHLLRRHILHSSLFLQNHLLNTYFKCSTAGSSALPLHLFAGMPRRNVVTWSAAINGLVHTNQPEQALSLFRQMLRAGERPNEFTLVSALNASSLSASQVYTLVVKLRLTSNVFLANALLTALIRNGEFEAAVEFFETSVVKDVVSWNSMMAGYLQFASSEVWRLWFRMNSEGMDPDEFSFSIVFTGLAATASSRSGSQVHGQLVKHGFGDDICVGNSLVDMYLKSRVLADGFKAFDEMPARDVVSWTQMASGCLLCGEPSEALEIVHRMKVTGVKPNRFTLATAFNACASLASLEEGMKAHGFRIKLGVDMDECVDNALVDMYAKCGSMESSGRVFRSMKQRSVISWTTAIMGFAQNGLAREAVEVFDEMIREATKPNYITFICVLYACSQGGFVDDAWKYFNSMRRDHGIDPGEDHYACMVDLLGKAGQIAEAEALILSMPRQPGEIVWQTLLGACHAHGDVETGKRAAAQALALEKKDPSTYILLSNMFANTSNWDGVGRVRELMENWEVDRAPGSSWIEVAGVHKHRIALQQVSPA